MSAWCCFTRTGASGLAGVRAANPPTAGSFPRAASTTARPSRPRPGASCTKRPATEDWITYDFPAGYGGTKQARGWSGQKQKWFAYRFIGPESEIDLEAHGEIEFDAWRWGRLDEACDLIVPFKRAVYEQVVAAFADLAG